MIKQTKELVVIENSHGGIGSIEIHKKLTKEDLVDGLSLFAKVVVKPNSTIGYHQHKDDAEAYYILQGTGVFLNHDKKRIPVKAGDLCLIKKGQSHGLENHNNNELEMIAIVY